jgi:hypothetical protein
MQRTSSLLLIAATAVAFAACSQRQAPSEGRSTTESLSKAAYTTWDASLGGCTDSPNGINCNHYTSKDLVYINGGPSGNNLPDGDYFFAVIKPGAQNTFLSAAPSTDGLLSSDEESARTFTMSGGVFTYTGGTHATGTSPAPESKPIVGLFPFDDTPNPGGVYILAICTSGPPRASSPSDCKFDEFKAPASVPPPPPDAGPDAGPDACPPDPPVCDPWCTLNCCDPCNCFCQCDP